MIHLLASGAKKRTETSGLLWLISHQVLKISLGHLKTARMTPSRMNEPGVEEQRSFIDAQIHLKTQKPSSFTRCAFCSTRSASYRHWFSNESKANLPSTLLGTIMRTAAEQQRKQNKARLFPLNGKLLRRSFRMTTRTLYIRAEQKSFSTHTHAFHSCPLRRGAWAQTHLNHLNYRCS